VLGPQHGLHRLPLLLGEAAQGDLGEGEPVGEPSGGDRIAIIEGASIRSEQLTTLGRAAEFYAGELGLHGSYTPVTPVDPDAPLHVDPVADDRELPARDADRRGEAAGIGAEPDRACGGELTGGEDVLGHPVPALAGLDQVRGCPEGHACLVRRPPLALRPEQVHSDPSTCAA
jgi:hypothetical protein